MLITYQSKPPQIFKQIMNPWSRKNLSLVKMLIEITLNANSKRFKQHIFLKNISNCHNLTQVASLGLKCEKLFLWYLRVQERRSLKPINCAIKVASLHLIWKHVLINYSYYNIIDGIYLVIKHLSAL